MYQKYPEIQQQTNSAFAEDFPHDEPWNDRLNGNCGSGADRFRGKAESRYSKKCATSIQFRVWFQMTQKNNIQQKDTVMAKAISYKY